ncbi:MAG: hypothetical protein FIA97_16085 [Methylococcaceae bacterium]|nr:hypothetical protein [Methylococcaceae bacterium]
MPIEFVIATGEDAPSTDSSAPIEWGFMMENLRSVNVGPILVSDDLTEYFAHQIARSPNNLLRHTQRIFFHFGSGDEEGLYSALLDLFMALKEKGRALRSRLLGGSKSRLSTERFDALARFVAEPVNETELPRGTLSVLSQGLTGILPIVSEERGPAESSRDVLVEAREHIEYFQLDEARTLLESALLDDPQRDDLQQELLALYLATNDMAGLRATRNQLAQLLDPLPEHWLAFDDQQDGADNP